ncbi:MAG: hypothetical protein ACI4WX_10865 [Aristaeellaceae bacterium]
MEWNWILITCLSIALTVAGMLIYLYKHGLLPEKTLTSMAALTEKLTEMLKDMGTHTVVASLSEYAAKAVRVVEQMVKNGQIEKDNEARKQKARCIVQSLALVDGADLDMIERSMDAVNDLIEAAVNEMQSDREIAETLGIMDGIDSDSLTDDQLRAILLQMGATPEQIAPEKTRKELYDLFDTYADKLVPADDVLKE